MLKESIFRDGLCENGLDFCAGVESGEKVPNNWVWIGFELGLNWVWIGFGLGSDWVRIGFAFFVFFWTGLIVSPYHSKCYSQSGRLKIGFGWYKRVTSVNGKFLCDCGAKER